jgi:hypothetical protein
VSVAVLSASLAWGSARISSCIDHCQEATRLFFFGGYAMYVDARAWRSGRELNRPQTSLEH